MDTLIADADKLFRLIGELSSRLKAAQALGDPVPSDLPATVDSVRALAESIRTRLHATGQSR
jgi:hypothetical protein